MLTMNWKDLQYKRPKQVKKKVIQKKGSQVVNVKYPLGKTTFSASDWEEYQQWIKQQKKFQQFKEKPPKPKKKKKGIDTKAKVVKGSKKPKNALTRKEQYHQQLEHPLWEKKRNIILKRDQYQCRLCGSKHNLQVHHIKYSSDKKAWEYPNLDLITLCEECHKKVHADQQHELNPYKKNN